MGPFEKVVSFTHLRKAPLPLRLYAGLTVAEILVSGALNASRHPLMVLVMTAFGLTLCLLLLRASRLIWSFLALVGAGSLILAILTPDAWWSILLEAVGLACLLTPASVRFIWPKGWPRRAAAQPHSANADQHPDSARPPGWYIDPNEPSRMRYWSGGDTGWHRRTTRTPRRVRQSVKSQA